MRINIHSDQSSGNSRLRTYTTNGDVVRVHIHLGSTATFQSLITDGLEWIEKTTLQPTVPASLHSQKRV